MIRAKEEIRGVEIARHYDELDLFYRDVWGDHVHHGLWLTGDEDRQLAVRQLVEWISREAEIREASRVCDIGCGYGATARMIAETFRAEVHAVTISPAQHAFARSVQNEGVKPTYVLADWLKNEFSDEFFDSAVAIESSEHMPGLEGFFSQARRVLKPGGLLVVSAWLSCERPSPVQKRYLLEPVCRGGRMPNMGTFSEYQRLAEESGFSVERVQDLTRGVERTWPRLAATFLRKLVSHPRYVRFLFGRHAGNRSFGLTMFRIWFSYRTGAMRYGVFTFRKRRGGGEL